MAAYSRGGAHLVRDTRDLPYAYKGEATVIEAVIGDYCPRCGECLPAVEEEARISARAQAFNKAVNAGMINPAEIIFAREVLQLGQREASLLFGGGINAFNRYEAGKTQPPRALVQLLRLLCKHPELLDELRADAGGIAREQAVHSIREASAGRLRTSSRK